MTPFTAVAIYLTIWWTVLFVVLPLGVTSHAEAGIDRGARIAAVALVDARIGMAGHAQRQDHEQHGPPDGQEDRDGGERTHQWAPLGVSMSSTRTPPMFLGWTKITGVPCAPMRGLPPLSTVAPLACMSSRAASMFSTSKQM